MRGKTITVKGTIHTTEDLTIGGRVDGPIVCDGCAVVIEPTAQITGDILADDITVLGRSDGQLTATSVVDIRAGATVTGRVISKRFILDAEATFNGRVEPQRLEAALSVAKYQQTKRESEP
jgi:cytoskeletal protein CcmA (bactofilin family)